MNTYIPKVYFLYAFPLDAERRDVYEGKGFQYPSRKEVFEGVNSVKSLWTTINEEDTIIKNIIEILKVAPPYDFEFCIIGGGLALTGSSTPLLLTLYSKDTPQEEYELIGTIIHELIHRFVASPRKTEQYDTSAYWEYIGETYKEFSKVAQNHLIVYAVLEKIYPTVLEQKQIESILDHDKEFPGYKEAIELVREKGADYFIEEFKSHLIKN